MWIRFNLPCDGDIQQKLHRIFRQEIKDWVNRSLVKGAVLTYHFYTPSRAGDSLYVCLDISAVKTSNERSVQLPKEAIDQIPSEIMSRIIQLCNENQIKFGIMNYEFDIEISECGRKFYRNAPTKEILRFASIGTEIALNILDEIENRKITFINNMELADVILSRLKKELGDDYFWLREAFHFVCNPMLLNDYYLWTLATS